MSPSRSFQGPDLFQMLSVATRSVVIRAFGFTADGAKSHPGPAPD
jgi:hypothetical protein